MGSTKHEKSFVDFEKPYEQNVIGFQGIVYFAVGLLLLIVITFGLMWALLGVFEDQAKIDKASDNPMAESEKDRLPVEPRIQGAPGFGVDGPNGWVNMELDAPQAEWRELHKQYLDEWANGKVDKATGAVTALRIEDAKQKMLDRKLPATSGPDAEKLFAESKLRFSDASAGRVATDRKR
jgi:hypothetical protein